MMKEKAELIKDKKDFAEIVLTRARFNDLGAELSETSNQIFALMRQQGSPAKVNFDHSYMFNADAANVDFSQSSLYGATFENVSVKGANLQMPQPQWSNFMPVNFPWWDAAVIEKELLRVLETRFYPGAQAKNLPFAVSKEDYLERVTALCKAAHLDCVKTYGDNLPSR